MAENFTQEQVTEYKEAFDLFDKNGDGTISTDELANIMRVLGGKPTDDQVAKILGEVDTNKSGRIEFNEFLDLMAKPRTSGPFGNAEDQEDEILMAFKVFDKDGSGFISESELREVMKALGETLDEEELRRMLDEADADHSGEIDYKEFQKILSSK